MTSTSVHAEAGLQRCRDKGLRCGCAAKKVAENYERRHSNDGGSASGVGPRGREGTEERIWIWEKGKCFAQNRLKRSSLCRN